MKRWLYNWHIKLFSVFLATLLWLYVKEEKTKTIEVKIPVVYRLPQDFTFLVDPPKNVSVKLQGEKEALQYALSTLKAYVNLKKVRAGVREYPLYYSQLPPKVRLVKAPKKIRLHIGEIIFKRVPIKVLWEGSSPKEDSFLLSPSEVYIRGVKEKVQKISSLSTPRVSWEELKEKKEILLSLKAPSGIEVEPPQVRLIYKE